MVVSNDIVAHIIGKGGHLIRELSDMAKVQRIDIQQEGDMNRMLCGYFGRTVTVLGPPASRLYAVYLLLRQASQVL
jgi:hypothetical protein